MGRERTTDRNCGSLYITCMSIEELQFNNIGAKSEQNRAKSNTKNNNRTTLELGKGYEKAKAARIALTKKLAL